MSQEQYDLSDLLNFDLDFEFDEFGKIPLIHNVSEFLIASDRFFDEQTNSLPWENDRQRITVSANFDFITRDYSVFEHRELPNQEVLLSKKHSLDVSVEDGVVSVSGRSLPVEVVSLSDRSKNTVNKAVLSIPSSTATSSDGKRQKAASFPAMPNKKKGVKTGKKTSATTTMMRQPPPPIPRSDVRYTYPRVLLNAFNSCDAVKLREVLSNYTSDDVACIHRYEGGNNPYGRDYTRLDGRQTVAQMWIGLFKSAPDFFFDILDTRAFHSPDWNVVIAARYNWVGTRVSDISLTRAADHERAAQLRLFSSKEHLTENESLRQQLEEEKEKALQHTTTHKADDSDSKGSAERKKVVEPLFQGKELILLKGEDFLLESKPCARREMRFTGRLLLHLDADNKINKIEFVYCATTPPVSSTPSSSSSTQQKVITSAEVSSSSSTSSEASSIADLKWDDDITYIF